MNGQGKLGISMDNNMKAELCTKSLENASKGYNIKDMIIHSDRGIQYTSELYKNALKNMK